MEHDAYGNEIWKARKLQMLAEYSSWQMFERVILKVIELLRTQGFVASDHVNQTINMIVVGKGATREATDYNLSRRAAYLVFMNADSSELEAQTVGSESPFSPLKRASNPLFQAK